MNALGMGTDSTRNVPFTDATVFKLTILLALSSVCILAQNRLSKRAKRKREGCIHRYDGC